MSAPRPPTEPFAAVCFWDHSEFSPQIHMYGIERVLLSEFTRLTISLLKGQQTWPPNPATAAAYFAWLAMSHEGLEGVGLINTPLGHTQGSTLQIIHGRQNILGGYGLNLIDLGQDELQVFGGQGFLDEDFNGAQVRTFRLSEVLDEVAPVDTKARLIRPEVTVGDVADYGAPPEPDPETGIYTSDRPIDLDKPASEIWPEPGTPDLTVSPFPNLFIDAEEHVAASPPEVPAVWPELHRGSEATDYPPHYGAEVAQAQAQALSPDPAQTAEYEASMKAAIALAEAHEQDELRKAKVDMAPKVVGKRHRWDPRGGNWPANETRTCKKCGLKATRRAHGPYALSREGVGAWESAKMVACEGARDG